VPLNKGAMNRLDNWIILAVAKIFNAKDDKIDAVRDYYDTPYIGDIIEKRRLNFCSKMLYYKYGVCFFIV